MIVNKATPGLRRPVHAASAWSLSVDQRRERMLEFLHARADMFAHRYHTEEMAALSPDLAKGDTSRAASHPTIWDYIKDSDKGSYSTQEGE